MNRAEAGAGGSGRARLALLGLGVALLAAHFAHRDLLGLEHLGWDTWPLILTSRVESAADLGAVLSRELMAGRYPLGEFFRPLTTLSFALDHALFGYAPFGYHLTNHIVLLCGVVAVFALARRLFTSPWAALLASLVYALHPMHTALVPIAARRADLLSAVLTLVALALLPRPGSAPPRARLIASGLVALGAAAAKETGAVVLPLALALLWLEGEGSARERLRPVLSASAGVLVAVAGFVLWRTLVLSGLGGHGESSLGGALAAAPALLLGYPALLARPLEPAAPGWLVLADIAVLVALARLVGGRAARSAVLLVGWLVLLALITGLAGEVRTWYAAPFVPWWALVAGLGLDTALGALARLDARRRLAPAALVLAALLVAAPLVDAPLFRRYEEWALVSAWERDFLAAARAGIERAEPGEVVDAPGLPRALRSDLRSMRAVGMDAYSVQAWAEASFPGLQVRVVEGGEPLAGPDEIVLRCAAGPPERRR